MHVVSFNSENLAGTWAGAVPENQRGDSRGRGAATGEEDEKRHRGDPAEHAFHVSEKKEVKGEPFTLQSQR